MDQTYTVSGMHCGACVGRLTAALAPFAERVAVTLTPPQAVLTNAREHDLAKLNAAASKAGGYTLAPQPSFTATPAASGDERNWLNTYFPLLLIAGYIAVVSLAGTTTAGSIDGKAWMTNFMAGFFLVFSAFKFLNLTGFADAYASYDLLAKRWRGWGLIYPFLELALGLAFLFRIAPALTQVATIALMGFSSFGVLDALRQKRQIPCACLGTVLKLPMSTITLVEDIAMVVMAAAMLLASGHN
jgi:cation transport ATPase